MTTYSEIHVKQAKKFNVPPQMMVFVDLLYLGYSDIEAYQVAYPEDTSLSLYQMRRKIMEVKGYKRFNTLYEERGKKHELTLSTPNDLSDIELIGSEEVAKEILVAARSLPAGSKERAEQFIKYYDVLQGSDIATPTYKDGTETVRNFFSEKCENECPLHITYMRHFRRILEDNEGIEEMSEFNLRPVIRDVHNVIKKIWQNDK